MAMMHSLKWLCLLWIVLLIGGQAHAAFSPTTSVHAVAADAYQARDRAIKQGQEAAFQYLIQSLVLRDDLSRLSILFETVTSHDYLLSFDIAEEKQSKTSYSARIRWNFDRQAIRNMLDNQAIAYADYVSDPVIIIPIYAYGSILSLWEADNPWLQAWHQADTHPLLSVKVPNGDWADLVGLSPQQALSVDCPVLQGFTRRYNTQDFVIVLLNAQPTTVPNMGALSVTVRPSGARGPQRLDIVTTGSQTSTDALNMAVQQTLTHLADSWKIRHAHLATGQRPVIQMALSFTSLDQWLEILKLIRRLSQDVDLKSLSAYHAQLQVTLLSTVDSARDALARRGWGLHLADDTAWIEKISPLHDSC